MHGLEIAKLISSECFLEACSSCTVQCK